METIISNKLLLDTPPLVLQKELAVALGSLDKAVVLQQVHFCTRAAKENNNQYTYRDGRWWVYNSYRQWKEDHFPFWSESKIGRVFRELEDAGLVISARHDAYKYNQSKWYAVDYGAFNRFVAERCTMDRVNLEPSSISECDDQPKQDDTIMSKTTTKTTTDTTQEGDEKNPADEKRAELQEKFGADPLAMIFKTSRKEEKQERPRGWHDASENEFTVCQRVAELWAGGKLSWAADDIQHDIEAAYHFLDEHGGDVRATIKTIDRYYESGGKELNAVGAYSLRKVIPKFLADNGAPGEPQVMRIF